MGVDAITLLPLADEDLHASVGSRRNGAVGEQPHAIIDERVTRTAAATAVVTGSAVPAATSVRVAAATTASAPGIVFSACVTAVTVLPVGTGCVGGISAGAPLMMTADP